MTRLSRFPVGTAAVFAALAVGACSPETAARSPAGPSADVFGNPPTNVTLCKVGSSATFSVSVNRGTPSSVSLDDGACQVVFTHTAGDRDSVFITEQSAGGGATLDSVVVKDDPGTASLKITGSNTIATFAGADAGHIVTFYNNPATVNLNGRMTGGGKQITFGGLQVTRGFELHCDIILANNLEINWAPANNFHITRPLTSATCLLDPNFNAPPPKSPINTFIGVANGELNGVPGATARFTFIDNGEPGSSDLASIQVYDASNNLVLNVPLSPLDAGNIQMHYDQPHGQKP